MEWTGAGRGKGKESREGGNWRRGREGEDPRPSPREGGGEGQSGTWVNSSRLAPGLSVLEDWKGGAGDGTELRRVTILS